MSNNVLFVQWGSTIPGREQKSLELFMAAQEFFFSLKNQGSIETCDFIGFETGNTSRSLGCMVVRGSASQIETIRNTPKFRELTGKSVDLVQNFAVNYGITGDALMSRVQEVVTWRKQLGIG